MTEPIIMYDSPEAAQIVTVTGWRSRNGYFSGDNEHAARYDGATHKHCDCGTVISVRGYCTACHDKSKRERWDRMPLSECTDMFAVHDDDRYFSEAEEFFEWCDENEIDPATIRLVACEPQAFREVEADYWEEELPEDGELPDDIWEAVKVLNAAIRAHGSPASWTTINKRIELAMDGRHSYRLPVEAKS